MRELNISPDTSNANLENSNLFSDYNRKRRKKKF